jgi:ribosomal protein S15P/S13E
MSNLGYSDGEDMILEAEWRHARKNVKHAEVDVDIALLLDRVQLLEQDMQVLKKELKDLKTLSITRKKRR